MSGLLPPSDEHPSKFTWPFARENRCYYILDTVVYVGLPVMAHYPSRMS